MKLVIAVIQPHKLDTVREALTDLDIHGMTVTEARGYGRQKGQREIYRGAEYEVSFIPKMRLEVAVADERVQDAIEAIRQGAQSGKIGDGKIFVTELDDVVRVRTGESGPDAL